MTKQVNGAVEHLTEVRQVIGIATSFVGLGAAIVTGNPVRLRRRGQYRQRLEESDAE